jgi:hypothetical protein
LGGLANGQIELWSTVHEDSRAHGGVIAINAGRLNLAKSYSDVLNEFWMNPYSMLKENENTLRGLLLGHLSFLFGIPR